MHRLTSPLSFFYNDTPTTDTYTLSLHDALPISITDPYLAPLPSPRHDGAAVVGEVLHVDRFGTLVSNIPGERSEEHTSELQSRQYLVCRLLLEKKKEK